jgi:hypothetical protein
MWGSCMALLWHMGHWFCSTNSLNNVLCCFFCTDLVPWYFDLFPLIKGQLKDCYFKDTAVSRGGFEDCLAGGCTWCILEVFWTTVRTLAEVCSYWSAVLWGQLCLKASSCLRIQDVALIHNVLKLPPEISHIGCQTDTVQYLVTAKVR